MRRTMSDAANIEETSDSPSEQATGEDSSVPSSNKEDNSETKESVSHTGMGTKITSQLSFVSDVVNSSPFRKSTEHVRDDLIGSSGLLHEAAEHGNKTIVQRYTSDKKNYESKKIMLSSDHENRNGLHKACLGGHHDCVHILLNAGRKRDKSGQTVREKEGEFVPIITANIDARDLFGCTALYLACVKNMIRKADGSAADPKRVTKTKLGIVKELLKEGADPKNAWVKGRGTALHWCAIHGFDEIAVELLKKGAELLYRLDRNQDLPLDVIGNELYNLRYKVEEEKAKQRANDSTPETETAPASQDLSLIPRKSIYKSIKNRKCSSKLDSLLNTHEACAVAMITAIELKDDQDYKLRWLQSMLLWSSYLGLSQIVQKILKVGKRLTVKLSLTWGGVSTQGGRTALHFAAMMGYQEIITELKSFYEDPSQVTKRSYIKEEDMRKKGCCGQQKSGKKMGFVNYPDHFDNTPLHLCAMQVNFPKEFGAAKETVEKLLGMGADPTLLNAEGRSSASYARGDMVKVYKDAAKKAGSEIDCFDSPRVKDEMILSFDWVIRFKHFTGKGQALQKKDSEEHQKDLKAYLERKHFLVKMVESPNKEYMLLMFTATEAVCLYHAGTLKIELPIINNRLDRAYNPDLGFLFEPLRSQERIKILKAVLDLEYDLDVFIRSGLIIDYFPMHETTELESVKSRWARGCCPEPYLTLDDLINENKSSVMAGLNTIAGYFGEEKAMYFAFTSFYSLYLCLYLMPLGLTVSVFQFYSVYQAGAVTPESLNHFSVPLFSLLISIWATATVEYWKRKQAELAFRWDTADLTREEKYRTEYWGAEKYNPATLTVVKDFSKKSRSRKRCAGYLVVLLMVGVVVAVFLFIRLFKLNFVPYQAQTDQIYWSSGAGVAQGIAIALMNFLYKEVAVWLTTTENYPTQTEHDNALIFKIFLFQFINGNMALMSAAFLDRDPVTLWSLLITLMVGNQVVSTVKNQVIPRAQYFWFQVVRSTNTVTTELVDRGSSLLSTEKSNSKVMPVNRERRDESIKLSHKDLTELETEVLETKFDLSKKKKREQQKIEKLSEIEQKKIDKLVEQNRLVVDIEETLGEKRKNIPEGTAQEGALTEVMRNCNMVDDDLLIDSYSQIILQFQYVVFWSAVFPLTPLVAVFLNMVQTRFEVTQLCYVTKRPIPKKEEGIGAWMTIVEIISLIGIVMNAAMIIMTFKSRDQFEKLLNTSAVSEVAQFELFAADPSMSLNNTMNTTTAVSSVSDGYFSTDVNFLWLMVFVEHGIIILKLILREFIEDEPPWVAQEKLAEEAEENRTEEREKLALEEHLHEVEDNLQKRMSLSGSVQIGGGVFEADSPAGRSRSRGGRGMKRTATMK